MHMVLQIKPIKILNSWHTKKIFLYSPNASEAFVIAIIYSKTNGIVEGSPNKDKRGGDKT